MNDAEKQDSRKTIIAFGAGLLIGALLVWAFSSIAPQAPEDEENTDDTVEETTPTSMDDDDGAEGTTTFEESDNSGEEASTSRNGTGELSVDDQPAGSTVVLEDVSFPDGIGWVAVRDYENGVAGNALGAARFDASVGLMPAEVKLLRATEAGRTYQVILFEDNGDLSYSPAGGDVAIENTATLFTAE